MMKLACERTVGGPVCLHGLWQVGVDVVASYKPRYSQDKTVNVTMTIQFFAVHSSLPDLEEPTI